MGTRNVKLHEDRPLPKKKILICTFNSYPNIPGNAIHMYILVIASTTVCLYPQAFRLSKQRFITLFYLLFQVCRNPIDTNWKLVYVVLISSFFFFLPAFILFVINLHVYIILRRTCTQFLSVSSTQEYRKRQRQVLHNIASIVTIFFVCHSPFRIFVIWMISVHRDTIGELGLERYLALLYSIRICFYLNHAINPLIYNFVSSKFRGAFVDVYKRIKRRRCCHSRTSHVILRRSSRQTGRTWTTAPRFHSNV